MTIPTPTDLDRFTKAQDAVWQTVVAELAAGRKQTHWMWFVFPQLKGLGTSAMAQRFAIDSLAQARAYLGHPVLGRRIAHACDMLMELQHLSAHEIFGWPDEVKLRSSMTLFAEASPPESVFSAVLRKYFDAKPDARTLEMLRDR